MKPAFWARRTHKWIALAVGIQATLWMLSGLYMTSVSLDIIHGDHLTDTHSEALSSLVTIIDPDSLVNEYGELETFRLKRLLNRDVYEIHQTDETILIDARSGERLSPMNEAMVRQLALSLYRGDANIAAVELLTKMPSDVKAQTLPIWRVSFDDYNESTLYFSPETGSLVAKRHNLWRLFDFLWMLHIMDYAERVDVNNMLLRIAASVGLLFSLSGLWLLFYSFRRKHL